MLSIHLKNGTTDGQGRWVASKVAQLAKQIRILFDSQGAFPYPIVGICDILCAESQVTEEHSDLVETRLKSDTEISNILSDLISTADADRAWLIEFHNGSKNLATGLPFLFGSMRMEEVRESIFHVDEEYADFSLSKYKLIVRTLQDGFFYGNLEDVREVDERLYYKFKANNVNEIALLTLYDCETPVGVLGLSFCNDKLMHRQMVGKEIRRGGVQIATLLSLKDGKG